jgi:pimeloyl-ACP methyl ester carboxylesterase
MIPSFKVESLLAARLFLSPQIAEGRVFFLSNMSGRLSLYAMDRAGSVPDPLLPPDIALMTPELLGGEPFYVFPKLGKVLVMIDRNGDENYQPHFIPLDGGIPALVFGDRFAGQQLVCSHCDPDRNVAIFNVDARTDPVQHSFLADLATLAITDLGSSIYGNVYEGANAGYSQIVLADGYTEGDAAIFLWQQGMGERKPLFGVPIEQRAAGQAVPLNSIACAQFTPGGGLLFLTSLFDDHYGLGYFPLSDPAAIRPVEIVGMVHAGAGELEHLEHLTGEPFDTAQGEPFDTAQGEPFDAAQGEPFDAAQGERYLVKYNIDGCSWAYEGTFSDANVCLTLDRVICGQGALSNGVAQSIRYDAVSGCYAIAFSTATSPAQIYISDKTFRVSADPKGLGLVQLTREHPIGIASSLLSSGEDASYTSHDGLRISARLYLPAAELGFAGPRPVVFYIHGGPQSQERPDFTWFSMPLIQFFTLNGFAVFVPNVRGSHGYGLDFTKRVDRDWGGLDRLDHVAAFEVLKADPRLDMTRAGVMGRSYGGYMTLTLAGRHPELWKAAVDMFGPYNLFTFIDRLPEAWKTYFHLAVGHPERDHDFLVERSPSTYLHQLACPMLVIQGRNDPRVRADESRDVVESHRAQGKQIEFLLFENEGHDVTRFENKVQCYNEIVRFFGEWLQQ